MRLHVLGLAHTETTAAFEHCAFTARTRDFATMLTRAGHEVILYGGEANEAECEHVPIVTRAEQRAWWPWYDGSGVFNDFDPSSPGWRAFNERARAAILGRLAPGDVVCVTMGTAQRPAVEGLPAIVVETGVGYSGVWAPFRVFESAAWRHFLAARESDDLRWYDAVIPRAWDPASFPVVERSDYALFVGRLMGRKGPHVAAMAAQRAGLRLLVAGQGAKSVEPGRITCDDGTLIEGDVEYLGLVGPQERARLMAGAVAVLAPTTYLEPGGGVAIEAQLAGTPAITTDWGCFTESVVQGVTGYRCATLGEFAAALRAAASLDPDRIRALAVERYGFEGVSRQWGRYLDRLATLAGAGWYA